MELWGIQPEVVNIEISRPQLAELKVHPKMILETLARHNKVVDAGALDLDGERIRLAPSGSFESVEEIGNLVVRGNPSDPMTVGAPSTDLVLLRDVAAIERGYLDPPMSMMRFNGRPAIGVAISTISGGNVVEMGEAVHRRLDELMAEFPVGLEVGTIAFQADNVQQAINGFMLNLIESVVIVIAVLLVTMGIRSGLLIGSGLVLTILGTLIVLSAVGVDLQRTSLGAFIIAMGMLVDNAIVVVEGILVRLQKNEPRMQAVVQPVVTTAWPLLGDTCRHPGLPADLPVGRQHGRVLRKPLHCRRRLAVGQLAAGDDPNARLLRHVSEAQAGPGRHRSLRRTRLPSLCQSTGEGPAPPACHTGGHGRPAGHGHLGIWAHRPDLLPQRHAQPVHGRLLASGRRVSPRWRTISKQSNGISAGNRAW